MRGERRERCPVLPVGFVWFGDAVVPVFPLHMGAASTISSFPWSVRSARPVSGKVWFFSPPANVLWAGRKATPPLGSRCKVRGPIFSATIPMLQGATPASHLRP